MAETRPPSDTTRDILGEEAPHQNFHALDMILPPLPHFTEPASNPALSPKLTSISKAQRLESASWHAILASTRQRFAVTARLIEELNEACTANHCKLVVLALPAPNNSMLYFRELQGMKRLAALDNFVFVNGNDVFPSLTPIEKSDLYYHIHLTPEGHALLGKQLFEALKSNHLAVAR
jgi:hypothetical protein